MTDSSRPLTLLLVIHGSRDPRPQIALQHLATQLAKEWQHSSIAPLPLQVATATLELGPPLHQQIYNLIQLTQPQTNPHPPHLHILPLFLLPGTHVLEDIPQEISQAQTLLHSTNPQPPTPNSKLQTPNSKPDPAELRTPNSEFRTPNSEFRIPTSELRTPNSKPDPSEFRPPTSEFRIPTSELRTPNSKPDPSEFRIPNSEFRPPNSKPDPSEFRIPNSEFRIPTLTLHPHLGSHPLFIQFLQNSQPLDRLPWILLAHGSRRPGSLQPLETLAEQLGMANAYWANAPSLADQVQKLVTNGVEHIGVLLYFLFPGGITDAIATEILSLRQQYPQVQFHLAPPLSDRPGFQDLLRDICVDQLQNSKNCKNSL